jgi:hypothetical protein
MNTPLISGSRHLGQVFKQTAIIGFASEMRSRHFDRQSGEVFAALGWSSSFGLNGGILIWV